MDATALLSVIYTSPVNAEGWLTQEEAAEKLHIALDTMRRYVREGKFPRSKVGKRYLIPASAIDDFLKGGLVDRPASRHASRSRARKID